MLHIKKIKPLFTSVIITGERFSEDMYDGSLLIAKKGDLKLWQKVVAVGTTVRDVKVGDKVMVNFANFAVRKYSKDSVQNDMDNNPTLRYDLNWVTIDDKNDKPVEHLLINDRDILYVFEGEERDDRIILPGAKNLILN